MFQIAAVIGLSKKYECDYTLPRWEYAGYFCSGIRYGNVKADFCIEETAFHYTPQFWDEWKSKIKKGNADLLGWFQTEKYWSHCKKEVYKNLSFSPEFLEAVKAKFARFFTRDTIAISIRRGDYVTNPNYYLLPVNYYLTALLHHFPDHQKYNVVFFSDDIRYCRINIRQLSNFYFVENASAIEQLCLMSLCNHFIISNSTFSWWGASFGEREGSKVIRPVFHFDGEFRLSKNWQDYYPDRWIPYNHDGSEIDVSMLQTGIFRKKISVFKIFLYKIYKRMWLKLHRYTPIL
ncbi:alpha-1,2-fucosyltransferase [Foetidibacter luteolus]|uniref:alpha-1,2-fucosyltransferase n=1 Tax=Foetidibacter luteolus TaxID=2608880 RepID=UPI001A992D36|nr:alpha-1,2-fucosyltransferase [Foetidibacter luteolus]